MGLILTLIIIGVLLLVAELVLLPGISVAGIGAFIALVVATFYGYMEYGIIGGSLILTAIVLLSVVTVIVSLRANTWRRFSLKTTINGTSSQTPQQQNVRIGQQGKTLTRMAPMGKVQLDNVTIEAKAMDAYIDPHQRVEVIGFDHTAVIVKRIDPTLSFPPDNSESTL